MRETVRSFAGAADANAAEVLNAPRWDVGKPKRATFVGWYAQARGVIRLWWDMEKDPESVYDAAGLRNRLGFGCCPAVLVVDMQYGFTDMAASPLAGDFSEEIDAVGTILAAARRVSAPIVYTAIGFEPHGHADAGLWVEKAPSLRHLVRGSRLVEIDARLAPEPTDTVIVKQYASAFFGTSLSSLLTSQRVDTLIVTGCTTSGCVRASVVDALSHGFRPIVAKEAVGDRARAPHEANLFDMDSKYGDVVTVPDVLGYLASLGQHDRKA